MPKKTNIPELKNFLDQKVELYNRPTFIPTDPISIPHCFSKKEDIEVAAFFAATIAWGQRTTIINNLNKLMILLEDEPHRFIINHSAKELKRFEKFVHRTFNGNDCVNFMKSLKHIYKNHGGLENIFLHEYLSGDFNFKKNIDHFRKLFFEIPHRSTKHVASPESGSASKRLNMYLRWLIRKDKRGVDFGLWPSNSKQNLSAYLFCPLDVHSGTVARKLGLLTRTQDDWKAVEELTANLSKLDPNDPVKYDFALFGLGAFENF